MKENPDYIVNQTVVHEAAHLIVYALYNGKAKAHGREWKSVMRRLGVNPSRCHNLDVSNSKQKSRRVKRYKAKCECMIHEITVIKYRRMVIGEATYLCRKCCGRLKSIAEK